MEMGNGPICLSSMRPDVGQFIAGAIHTKKYSTEHWVSQKEQEGKRMGQGGRKCPINSIVLLTWRWDSRIQANQQGFEGSVSPMGLQPAWGDMMCAMAGTLMSQQSKDILLERK
jgi:hypothetical protein